MFIGNHLQKLLQALILTLSLGWILYLLTNIISEHGVAHFLPTNWSWLFLATLLLMLSMLPNAFIFWELVSREAKHPFPWQSALLLHMKGQLARYLPGRFWGVLYQINAARKHLSSANVSKANIDLMIISLLGNLLIPLGILSCLNNLPLWVFFTTLCTIVLAYLLFYRSQFFHMLYDRLCRMKLLPAKLTSFLTELKDIRLGKKLLFSSLILFFGSWIIYLGAWKVLTQAYALTESHFAILAAWYSIAWLIGFIAAFTPGGLGIREASFVLFAQQGIDTNTLAFIAVIARLWLMLADVLLVIVTTFFLRIFTQDE